MDFEQNNGPTEPAEPEPLKPTPMSSQSAPPTAKTPPKKSGWKIFWGIITVLSVLANIALLLMLLGVIAFFAATREGVLTEEVIQAGPRAQKIVIITLQGIIDGEQARNIYKQLKAAREDKRVKGLIIRVNSPGGTISASDQIYNEILKYRTDSGKPVVAFMQGIAASGGYYTSVACDKIVAEPTVITGSIGVIFGYLVLEDLFKEKLGIEPVVVKSGLKKDWPSSLRTPQDQEIQYLHEKLITPAYERFVHVVADGRKDLTPQNVRDLGDGSIYGAPEALDEKLIDKVGYLDEAINLVMSLAGLEKARVVEYYRPFSLAGFLTGRCKNILTLNKKVLYELSTPQLLYLWNMY